MMIAWFKAFRRDIRGSTIVEFALLAPVLLTLLLGSVTAFDMYRNAQNVEKATFTIGDMLSREKGLTDAKLNDMLVLLRNLVPTSSDGGLRITSLTKKNGVYVVQWTRSKGNNVPTTPIPVAMVPNIVEGDSIIFTESYVPHVPMVAGFGFGNIVFHSQAAHRPRFVTSIPLQ